MVFLKVRMKRITHGACCAIKLNSSTGDVAALRRDLRNGIQHYFGYHQQCTGKLPIHTVSDNAPSGTIKTAIAVYLRYL